MNLRRRQGTLARMRVLISSGPTREPIDKVRFLSNYSTGYMGCVVAAEALSRGHRVTVISGPTIEPLPSGARVIYVEDSRAMQSAMRRQWRAADCIIMTAAISDFRPVHKAHTKLPRRGGLSLKLQSTPDVIAGLPRRPGQVRAGFALESGYTVSRSLEKLRAKRLDLLVAQKLNGRMSPFGRKKVRAWLMARSLAADGRTERSATVQDLGIASKRRVARLLLDKIERLWYGQEMSER